MLKTFATLAIAAYAIEIEAELAKSHNLEMDVTQISAVAIGASVTASTCWDEHHCIDRARLNYYSDIGSNSWCARFNDQNQWLEVYFGGQRQLVTEVATQGRGKYDQWVTEFNLMCSQDGETWTKIGNFKGNKDTETVVYNKLAEPQWCRAVRFNPTAWNNHISMRAEVYYSLI